MFEKLLAIQALQRKKNLSKRLPVIVSDSLIIHDFLLKEI